MNLDVGRWLLFMLVLLHVTIHCWLAVPTYPVQGDDVCGLSASRLR